MAVSSVELVTLSDSLTLPVARPKRPQIIVDEGARKIVCLDSDTESDGSFAQIGINSVALRARSDEHCDGLPHCCEKGSEKWLGSHKCTNDKAVMENHSQSPLKDLEKEIDETLNTSRCPEGMLSAVVNSTTKTSIKTAVGTDDSHQQLHCVDRPDADHQGFQPYRNCSDINFCSMHSPVMSPNLPNCSENSNPVNVVVPSVLCNNYSNLSSPSTSEELHEKRSLGLSSTNKDSADCSSPAWDDHLKEIVTKLDSSIEHRLLENPLKNTIEQESEDEYAYHDPVDGIHERGYSFKDSWHRYDTGSAVARGKQDLCKSLETTMKRCTKAMAKKAGGSTSTEHGFNDSVGASGKEMAKLKKKERQIKDTEEREAKKQQVKLKSDMLKSSKQEKKRLFEELKKLRNEEEKKRREALRAEAAERRKLDKEKEKWEKGKFALQNITALVDTEILEAGLVGGHLLTRFAEKGFKYHIVKNPVRKTVVWQIKVPSKESRTDLQEECLSEDSSNQKFLKNAGPQLSLETVPVSYVLIVLEASEFSEMITNNILDTHIRNLQRTYPGFTLCYLINRLIWFLQKREREHYKTPGDNWQRPPVEQVQNG